MHYLYSAANFSGPSEQSTSSPCRARSTGQYFKNSPTDVSNSDGVTHKPCMGAT